MIHTGVEVHPASFRDPAGFLCHRNGTLYRHVAHCYAVHYDRLLSSGLYDELVVSRRMVRHEELPAEAGSDAYRVLRPEPLPFISYPYEWCFSQLRDAALLTLEVLEAALARGLILKDASAYNIQFLGTRPLLIDTLSFEVYQEGEPWVAYRQFCEHFVAPLALLAYVDLRLTGLWRSHLDGVPLDLARALAPWRTRLRPGLLLHLHLHARSQVRHAARPMPPARPALSRRALHALVDSLRETIRRMRPAGSASAWIDYDLDNSYLRTASEQKEQLTGRWLQELRPRQVWDLGANLGRFSRLANAAGAFAVAFDADARVVEAAYTRARAEKLEDFLPLLMDLANPSPGLGWEGRERDPLEARASVDVVLALAVVHHLALGRNLPLPRIAHWLAKLAPTAIVEFVPKEDAQAQRLLQARRDVFDDYDRRGFERAFAAHYRLDAREELGTSGRCLYLWTRSE